MITWFSEQFATNQFFSGAVTASIIAALIVQLRALPSKIWNYVSKVLTVSVKVTDDTALYDEFSRWILSLKEFSNLKTISRLSQQDSCPSNGTYLRWYLNRPVILQVTEEKNQNGGFTRSLCLSSFGLGANFLHTLTKKLDDFLLEERKSRNYVFVHVQTREFGVVTTKSSKRTIDSVFTKGDIHKEVLADLLSFLKKQQYYTERGIPYKRCIVLNGKPGCGKTSLIRAIAHELNRNIHMINLDNSDNGFISDWVEIAADRNIVVIEDVDVLGNVRREDDKEGVTLSTLLNCIDGVFTQPGSIIFMTTNHLDKLDPALIRPGRADFILELGELDEGSAKKMAAAFHVSWEEVLKEMPAPFWNPATLQGLLVEKSHSLLKMYEEQDGNSWNPEHSRHKNVRAGSRGINLPTFKRK